MAATKLEYNGSVKDGKITLPKRLRAEVVASFEGKQIRVVFERKKKVRTPSQNSYYWAVIVPMILDEMINLGNEGLQSGNEEDLKMIHDFLKDRFLKPIVVADANGVEMKMKPSTKTLSTVEFMEFIEDICRWAAESLHLNIPQPGEQTELFDHEQ